MIKAVLEANVVAAGIPAKVGTLTLLFDRWFARNFELVLSEIILGEVRITWAKPYWRARMTAEQVEACFAVTPRSRPLP